jgi:uncharacterized protein with PQ loop repeat
MTVLETFGNVCGFLYAGIFCFSYVPQFLKTMKTKKVDDLSLNMFTLSVIAYLCLFSYQFYIGFKLALILNCALGGSFSVYFVYAILRYRTKK